MYTLLGFVPHLFPCSKRCPFCVKEVEMLSGKQQAIKMKVAVLLLCVFCLWEVMEISAEVVC